MKRTKLFHVGFIVAAVLGMLVIQCGGDDPCDPDPCPDVDGVAGSCVEFGPNDFQCDCAHGVEWDGAANRCGECIPDCEGRECGPDGCGGSCGECDPGVDCIDGQCEECIPDCTGRECGDDGCGGSCGECDPGEICEDGLCVGGGGPEYQGGSYEMRAWDIEQDPGGCLLAPAAVLIVRPILRGIVIPVDIPSGEVIVDFFGNAYPLDINLPVFGLITVDLSLDGTYENMLMDGPDVYEADTSGLGIPGADCVITGSADGIFDDINTEPLTGSLTIDIASVEDSPGGTCSLLKKPTEACAITVILDAGSPL